MESNSGLLAIFPRRFEFKTIDDMAKQLSHDRRVTGLTPTQASQLRPWVRCSTIIIPAWWTLTSSKLKKLKNKSQVENSEAKSSPERVWDLSYVKRLRRFLMTGR